MCWFDCGRGQQRCVWSGCGLPGPGVWSAHAGRGGHGHPGGTRLHPPEPRQLDLQLQVHTLTPSTPSHFPHPHTLHTLHTLTFLILSDFSHPHSHFNPIYTHEVNSNFTRVIPKLHCKPCHYTCTYTKYIGCHYNKSYLNT